MSSLFVIWITGPSGAGKTTLARALEKRLKEMGLKTEVLDGDEIRKKLYPNLGFDKEARKTHNRVVIYMAKLLLRNGVVPIVALISPYKSIREKARKELGNFVEVYLKCPLEERMKRDPKGLYLKALKGEVNNLTGLDGVYEEPENPEVVLETDKISVEEEVELIVEKIKELKYL